MNDTQNEWERPSTIDDIDDIRKLTNDDLRDTISWAKENISSYIELIEKLKIEQRRRKHEE